jgi:hypothetical protein
MGSSEHSAGDIPTGEWDWASTSAVCFPFVWAICRVSDLSCGDLSTERQIGLGSSGDVHTYSRTHARTHAHTDHGQKVHTYHRR